MNVNRSIVEYYGLLAYYFVCFGLRRKSIVRRDGRQTDVRFGEFLRFCAFLASGVVGNIASANP